MSSDTLMGMVASPRMRAAERRELVLVAATRVFGDYGFFGTTTATVAREAGVSQPYVVRIFGTKEKLFLEVLQRAQDLLIERVRAAIDEQSDDPVTTRIGRAYIGLVAENGLLLTLNHGFALGLDPVIGALGRSGFVRVYRVLREEAGFSALEAQEFLASGMLLNTMLGLRMAEDYTSDSAARELLETAFPANLAAVLAFADQKSAERQPDRRAEQAGR